MKRRGWRAGGLALLVAIGVRADEAKPGRLPPDFRQVAPLASVREAARAAHMELDGRAAPARREGLRPGDAVTALVTLTEGKTSKQWLIVVQAVAPAEKAKPGANRASRLFSSTGHEFNFGSGRATLEIAILGPFGEADAGTQRASEPEVKRRRVEVGADFLALGLERVPAMILKVQVAEAANPELKKGGFQIGGRPFPPDVVAAGRKRAQAVGMTEADERAVAGSLLALTEYFQLTSSTPGLQDVLMSVLDVPWWSIVTSLKGPEPSIDLGAVVTAVRPLDAAEWGLDAGAPVYAYPFLLTLNGKPALLCQVAVVPPQPPLLASAGIIGLAAGRPDGKGPVLTLQVVASRVAGEKPAQSGP